MNSGLLLTHFNRISEAPDAIARLRSFVLDLAVRGKLVEQDPKDEPASELLNSIRSEKARLVKQKTPLDRGQLVSTATEASQFVIPRGWVVTTLGEVAHKITDGAHKTPTYLDRGVPFISVKNFSGGKLDFSHTRLISPQEHATLYKRCDPRRGDILIGRIGTLGKAVLVDTDMEFSLFVSVGLIRFSQIFIAPPYFRMLLNSPLLESEYNRIKVGGATHTNKLNLGDLHTLVFPLPPLAEQHRIVAKVDELMALCDRLEATQLQRETRRDRLAAASHHYLTNSANPEGFRERSHFCLNHFPRLTTRPEQIPALRKTILSLAVRGQLVPQNPSDEPASELLKRIQAEKARLTENGNIKKDKRAWEGLPKNPPHELPVAWIWTCLQDAFEISRGGSPRPAGDPRYFGGPIPWITVREITKDGEKYLTSTEGGLTEEGATRSRFIESGDLLLTNSGATLGVPKISRIRACMNDGVAVLRLFHSIPLNDFAYLYLHSQTEAFRKVNQGMGQPNLNTPIIAGWFFPLPPLAEQHRIVAKVDELMAVCDRLEEQLSALRHESSRLLESVLHHALKETEEEGVPPGVPTVVAAVSSLR